ncbi:MAG TPA: anti-sigma factor [Actinomycetota bacterium]|nr:anti-sigma factor [Actinomycetota bacterium]
MSDIHHQIESLIAAYAMGAVPEREVPAIRAHILSCEACFAEAESYTDALAVLSSSVAPIPLSTGFADRVLVTARGGPPPQADETTGAGRLWRPLVRGIAVLGLIALLATTAALLRSTGRQQAFERVLASLVRDPNALALHGPGGAEGMIASTNEGLVLVALDLGEAPRGRDYQLWLIKDGVPTPSVTFDVTDSIVVVESPENLDIYEGAAVTVEPNGGSRQPTTEPVLAT